MKGGRGDKKGKGGEGKGWKGRGREMEGPTYKEGGEGRGGKKGRGMVPPVITVPPGPGSRGARIVTAVKSKSDCKNIKSFQFQG